MKLGSEVYAGSARLRGTVAGIFETMVSVHVEQFGVRRMYPVDQVVQRRRPPLFAVGDEVNILLDEILCRGVVTRSQPLHAKVTCGHPVWEGAEVSGREAVIGKLEEEP